MKRPLKNILKITVLLLLSACSPSLIDITAPLSDSSTSLTGSSPSPSPSSSSAPLSSYTVTYNSNGATSGSVPTDSKSPYTTGSTVTVLGNTGSLVNTGYTFSGWNTAADGSGTAQAASSTLTVGSSSVVLYAQWTIGKFTVTYNSNGATSGTIPSDSNSPYSYNTTVTLLGNTGTLAKTGSVFAGWNTSADGKGTPYSGGDTLTMGGANLTLYAEWALFTSLYSFGNGSDGAQPYGSLINVNGALYGLLYGGGTNGSGAIFSYVPGGSESVVWSLGGADAGTNAYGNLFNLNGILYGFSTYGGSYTDGNIISYNISNNTASDNYDLGSIGSDAVVSLGSFIDVPSNGVDTLYALAQQGGANNKGAIIRYVPSTVKETVLYSFVAGVSDGQSPYESSLTNVNGILYGMTKFGGTSNIGTIIKYNIQTGIETLVHSFVGGASDGSGPYGSFLNINGILYGMTISGGSSNKGVIFSYNTSSGAMSIVHSFAGGASDGAGPHGSLININTTLYGLTNSGGTYSSGVLFGLGL